MVSTHTGTRTHTAGHLRLTRIYVAQRGERDGRVVSFKRIVFVSVERGGVYLHRTVTEVTVTEAASPLPLLLSGESGSGCRLAGGRADDQRSIRADQLITRNLRGG